MCIHMRTCTHRHVFVRVYTHANAYADIYKYILEPRGKEVSTALKRSAMLVISHNWPVHGICEPATLA